MKPARLPLILAGVLLALASVAAGLAFNPSLQRWAVLRWAAQQKGLRFAAAEISAGPAHVTLREVRAEKGGVTLSLGRLDADYSLWALLISRRLQLDRVVARDLFVDLSRLSRARAEAGATAGTAAAPGLLDRAALPVGISLDGCDVTGRALLPGAPGRPPVPVEFSLGGGGIAPGREGRLQLRATLRDPAADARVRTLQVQSDLRAAQTLQQTFSLIGVEAVIDASGPQLDGRSRLKITAELSRSGAGDTYTVNIDTSVRGQTAHLLDVRAQQPAGRRTFAGEWLLRMNTAQVEPFFLGGALPDFSAQGEGRFTFEAGTAALGLQGRLEIAADELGAIRPELRSFGAVKINGEFDLSRDGPVARLNRFDLTVAGAQPVLEMHAARAAEFNLSTRRLQLGGGATGEILRLRLQQFPVAWLRPFIRSVDVSGGSVTGEISLTSDDSGLVAQTVAPLQAGELTFVREGRVLLGGAVLSIDAGAQLSSGVILASLRDFALRTTAGDSVSAQGDVTLIGGQVRAVAARYTADLPTLLAPWLPLGRLQAKGDAEFTLGESAVELRRLTAQVADAGGQPLFTAATRRPFSLDYAKGRAHAADGGAELLEVKFGRIALDRLLPGPAGFTLGGELQQGDFVLLAEGDKLVLAARAPLRLGGLSLARQGRKLAAGLALEARPRIEFDGTAGGTVHSGEAVLRNTAGDALLNFQADVTRGADGTGQSTISFGSDLTALAALPVFARLRPLAQGRASGELRLANDRAGTQAEARMTLNGLVAREGNQTLPVANLSLRLSAERGGRVTVEAPVLLDRAGGRSDLNFSAELTPEHGQGFAVDAKITGGQLELNDALQLLGAFAPSLEQRPAAPGEADTAVAATQPAWAGMGGRITLDVKSVTRGAKWTMTGLTGLVTLDEKRLALQKLSADLGPGSALQAGGELAFTGGAQPYALKGDFSLTGFDAGAFFRAFEPGRPPTIEGLFAIKGRLTGGGANVRHTLERARGQFELTSRQGIFRGLKRTSDKVSNTTKAVELGAAVLGSIFGKEKVTRAAEKVAGHAYYIDQLAQQLAEIPYDQLSLRLQRGESLHVALEDLVLVAPEIRVLGRGEVTYVEGRPLLEQPLSAEVTLAARGKVEQLLGKIEVLDGTRDELGYARMKFPVTVGGTLEKPDPGPLFTRIAKTKITDFLMPGN